MKKKFITATLLLALILPVGQISIASEKASSAANQESSTMKNVVSDSAITAAIKAKFIADDQVSALNIHVDTVNGKVTLTGKVPSESAKERAIAIAKATNGVHEVVSNLELR
jgi:hyperosmotically inducible protein